MARFPDALSYVCKSLGLRGFEFQLYYLLKIFHHYFAKWSLSVQDSSDFHNSNLFSEQLGTHCMLEL